MDILWILLFGFVVSINEARRSENVLNKSKGKQEPVLFWPMTRAKHDTTFINNHSYAFLQRTGPPTPSLLSAGGMDVVDFGAVRSKYIILNSFGDLEYDGFIDAISFSFKIYFTNTTQNTVLAQFIDADGIVTLELRLEGLMVTARWLDINLEEYTGSLKVRAGEWLLLGFQFNMLWTIDEQVDLYFVDSEFTVALPFGMGDRMVTLPVMDKIVIGGDCLGNGTFIGEIGCIQIYNTSILQGTRHESVDLCDQSTMDPELGDYTIELPVDIPTTDDVTAVPQCDVTTVTTEVLTDGKMFTDNFSESSGITSTDGMMITDTLSESSGVIGTAIESSPADDLKMLALTKFDTGYEPVVENCFHLKIVQTNQTLASPITSVQVANLERCAILYNEDPHCLVFSLPSTGSGECRTSDTTVTTPMVDYLVYSI